MKVEKTKSWLYVHKEIQSAEIDICSYYIQIEMGCAVYLDP